MPKIPIIDSDDDMILWQRVVSQVKPLKSTVQSSDMFDSPVLQKKTLPKNFRSACRKIRVVTKSMHLSSLNKTPFVPQKTEPVDLRQGDGLTTVNAESNLGQFIEIAAYDGCRCVLVITGKGAGVLRRHVPNWLKQPPLAPHVLALAEARPKDGGGGALYVLLRRKRNG